ncbi:hypothetical protein BI344_17085 [Chromobacterium sphagni]|uniref:Uncharacterized protein n=1 Tax=Chromobacterium sphagni TaxID=1903179 RepID=A0ABX3CBX5_9NEIS|nr:hypothetical protein BI344_17085 [Chromobacterium sphagni]
MRRFGLLYYLPGLLINVIHSQAFSSAEFLFQLSIFCGDSRFDLTIRCAKLLLTLLLGLVISRFIFTQVFRTLYSSLSRRRIRQRLEL